MRAQLSLCHFTTNMAEEEDPVEHEIDVYLSKSLAEKLYLLQYPVRPTFMTYDNSNHISARVKPKQKKVELEVGIDTRSQNYARSKGEQIALNVDGAARGTSGSYYTSDKMDKQLLSSVPSTDSSGRYAVGVYKEGELHLTPLHALVQLRPSFSFLDKADIKMKTDVGPGGDMGGESSQDEEEEAKPVTMKFARQETEEAKARRMASYNYLQKKQEEESWVPVQFHNIDDGISESERLHLISNRGDELSEFQLQPKEYLHMLIPPPDETQEEKPAMPSNVLSLTQLRTMPLPDQIKTLLTNAKVIRFAQLMALLPQGSDTMAALRSLQQVALLVQGCWVVKSEVLYPKEACSPHSGVSAEHLCRGRDYVMWRFTQSRHVTRKDIASIVKLPAEDVKEILEQISKIRVNCGWEFLFTHDSEFTNRYPDIVQRQKMLWNAKYQSLCKQLKIPKEHDKKFKEKEQSNPSTEKTGRQRRNSSRSPGTRRKRTLSGRSLSDYSDIEMDNLKSDQEVTIEDDDHAPRLDEPMEVNNTNHVSNGPSLSAKANLNCSISEVSIELKTELINFVQEKLISRFVLSASELRRLFLMKVTQCPPGHILGTGVSDKLLEETVLQVGGVQLENQWPPNVKEEPIFALPKTGDKLDPARTVLLNWFNKNYKITKKSFTKAVEDETGETMSDNDCKLLLKDYCQAKGIMWYLKGTSASS